MQHDLFLMGNFWCAIMIGLERLKPMISDIDRLTGATCCFPRYSSAQPKRARSNKTHLDIQSHLVRLHGGVVG